MIWRKTCLILSSILCLVLLTVACSPKADTASPSNIPVIADADSSMIIVQLAHDGMDRGNHEYQAQGTVIDPNYYSDAPILRGDVVYFQNESKQDIARIVALPGEKLKIESGQMYINGKVLNEFYGYETRYGKKVTDSDANFSIKVPRGAYYLMADNWYRWGFLKESVPKEEIIGKVIGAKK